MKLVGNKPVSTDRPFRIGASIRFTNDEDRTRLQVLGYTQCTKTQQRNCGKRCASHGWMMQYRYLDDTHSNNSCLYVRDWDTDKLVLHFKEIKPKAKPQPKGEFAKLLKRKHVHPLLQRKR